CRARRRPPRSARWSGGACSPSARAWSSPAGSRWWYRSCRLLLGRLPGPPILGGVAGVLSKARIRDRRDCHPIGHIASKRYSPQDWGAGGAPLRLPLPHRSGALGEDLVGQAADLGGGAAELLVERGRSDRADLRAEEAGVGVPLDDVDVALVEADGVLAVDHLLRLLDEGVQVGAQRVEPLAVVDQRGPALVDALLEDDLVLGQAPALQVAVQLEDDRGAGGLVDLARLEVHDAVFPQVELADAVLAADLVEQRDQLLQRQRLAVDPGRHARLEGDRQGGRLVGRLLRRGEP